MTKKIKNLACIGLAAALTIGIVSSDININNTAIKAATTTTASKEMQTLQSNKYGVYYEVFVRSFADSNGDGIGDLKGLTDKLDYLNDGNPKTKSDLGVNALWLMPINTSPSYHKYDVTDYYNIDPEYGTMKDFENLIAQAHKRGIKIIMDLVVNHTSKEHPWFQSASSSVNSPYRDYYTWASPNQKGLDLNASSISGKVWHPDGDSFYYALFWDGMPDLNYDNQKVRKEIENVAAFWLKKGVDGFRLDAARHIYWDYERPGVQGTEAITSKNVAWWQEFRNACKKINPNVYLVGEVADNDANAVAPYFKGLDSTFDFGIADKIINILNSEKDLNGTPNEAAIDFQKVYETYKKAASDYIDCPFLTNHDQQRIMDDINGNTAKAKLGANIFLTLPGNPFIYYGEELGMHGTKPDEMIREPFNWSDTNKASNTLWELDSINLDTQPEDIQAKNPDSILNHYKELISLRQSDKALSLGDFNAIYGNNSSVVAYLRKYGSSNDKLVIFHNLSSKPQIETVKNLTPSKYKVFYKSSKEKYEITNSYVSLPGYSSLIIKK